MESLWTFSPSIAESPTGPGTPIAPYKKERAKILNKTLIVCWPEKVV